jgi:hypothetical protein
LGPPLFLNVIATLYTPNNFREFIQKARFYAASQKKITTINIPNLQSLKVTPVLEKLMTTSLPRIVKATPSFLQGLGVLDDNKRVTLSTKFLAGGSAIGLAGLAFNIYNGTVNV